MSGRGGVRPGAGRTAESGAVRERVTIRLTPAEQAELRRLGDGQIGEGIRYLLTLAADGIKERHPMADEIKATRPPAPARPLPVAANVPEQLAAALQRLKATPPPPVKPIAPISAERAALLATIQAPKPSAAPRRPVPQRITPAEMLASIRSVPKPTSGTPAGAASPVRHTTPAARPRESSDDGDTQWWQSATSNE